MLLYVLLNIGIGNLNAAETVIPTRGLYHCVKGNEESICDQYLIPQLDRAGEMVGNVNMLAASLRDVMNAVSEAERIVQESSTISDSGAALAGWPGHGVQC